MMCCWYLGNLESYRSMADRFGVPKSTYHSCCKRIVRCLSKDLMGEHVTWPVGSRVDNVKDGFSELCALEKGIIGAIDGTHIPIKTPRQHPESYINRKKFHSLVMQGVCDHTMRFTHVYCGWPGSTHDARVLRNSSICRNPGAKCINNDYLIGDSAYPLQPWLMTPFRDNGRLTRQQKRFNIQLSRGRQVIERAFGLLKNKWRRLYRFDGDDTAFLVDSILAAACLHNIGIDDGDVTDLTEAHDHDDQPNDCLDQLYLDDSDASQKRNNMANAL